MIKLVPTFILTAVLLPVAALGQVVEQYAPPRANCCLPAAAKGLADQLQDWNQLGRYYADNQRLMQLPPETGRVVFIGDSITDGWKLGQFFPGKAYVNRGISGQTTPQMLVRMFPDVIALKPAALLIFAGTNDIAGNTGPSTLTMIEDNLQAMTELAQAHGIKVILCSVTPVSDYARKQTVQRPPSDILKLNAWIREYAGRVSAVYADYYAALVDETGMLKQGFSGDGLHPTIKAMPFSFPSPNPRFPRRCNNRPVAQEGAAASTGRPTPRSCRSLQSGSTRHGTLPGSTASAAKSPVSRLCIRWCTGGRQLQPPYRLSLPTGRQTAPPEHLSQSLGTVPGDSCRSIALFHHSPHSQTGPPRYRSPAPPVDSISLESAGTSNVPPSPSGDTGAISPTASPSRNRWYSLSGR